VRNKKKEVVIKLSLEKPDQPISIEVLDELQLDEHYFTIAEPT
jgi:hypothetical protein